SGRPALPAPPNSPISYRNCRIRRGDRPLPLESAYTVGDGVVARSWLVGGVAQGGGTVGGELRRRPPRAPAHHSHDARPSGAGGRCRHLRAAPPERAPARSRSAPPDAAGPEARPPRVGRRDAPDRA